MFKKILYLVFILIFFFQCKLDKVDEKELLEAYTASGTRQPYILKKLIIENCDTIAYLELKKAYRYTTYKGAVLYYSLFMANNCNYAPAYLDVYYEIKHNDISKLNEGSKTLMINYLKKGAELGNRKSQYELGRLYKEGEYLPKNEELGNKLIMLGDSLKKDDPEFEWWY